MAGKSGFKVKWAGLDKLAGRALDGLGRTDELMAALGELVVSQTMRNFQLEQAPDGTKWKKSRRAVLQGGKTLQKEGMRGGLMGSITYKVGSGGTEVYIGSNKPYAAIHQCGGKIRPKNKKFLVFPGADGDTVFAKEVTIPARPYIGLNQEIEDEAREIMKEFIKDSLSL